jgi:hypothetical protein
MLCKKNSIHIHQFEILNFSLPKYSFYFDNNSEQAVNWPEEKQQNLYANEKIVILNLLTFQM